MKTGSLPAHRSIEVGLYEEQKVYQHHNGEFRRYDIGLSLHSRFLVVDSKSFS